MLPIKYTMPEYWTKDISNLVTERNIRFFTKDIDLNRFVSTIEHRDGLHTVYHSNGFYADTFEFVLAPDENGIVSLSLEGVNEPIVISEIRLVPTKNFLPIMII